MRIQRLDEVSWKALQISLMRVTTSFGLYEANRKSEQFLFAVAAIFSLACKHFRIRPADVLARVDRLIRTMEEGAHDGGGQTLKGVRMYLAEEFKDYDT